MADRSLYFNRGDIRVFLEGIRSKKIIVIGDVMLDHYVWGKVERISPEAPVPVVALDKENYRLGGAGNVANNLSSIGAATSIMGVVGDDLSGKKMEALFEKAGIDFNHLMTDSTRPTSTKTRIIAHNQQVVRVDRESTISVRGEIIQDALKSLAGIIDSYDAVIISDYNKGFVTGELIRECINICNRKGKIITIDPKKTDLHVYDESFIITPNLKEIENFVGRRISLDDLGEIKNVGMEILEGSCIKNILLTLGEAGMMLFTRDRENPVTHIKTKAKDVYDVTGAGDTVIALFTAGYASGFDTLRSAHLANIAAGIVIRRVGTTPIRGDDLAEFFEDGD